MWWGLRWLEGRLSWGHLWSLSSPPLIPKTIRIQRREELQQLELSPAPHSFLSDITELWNHWVTGTRAPAQPHALSGVRGTMKLWAALYRFSPLRGWGRGHLIPSWPLFDEDFLPIFPNTIFPSLTWAWLTYYFFHRSWTVYFLLIKTLSIALRPTINFPLNGVF